MASRVGPRTVKDATRFTSTIPHAASKSATPSSAVTAASRYAASSPKAATSRLPGETPEQRVKRLRLAHLAAQKAQVSTMDKILDAGRRTADVAHRWTVGGIVVFTAVAAVVSVYSVWDMLRYNRARRAEWIETQKQFESDSLATARLAYISGTATEEQILEVEEANRQAEAQGVKLPPLLPPPEQRTHFEEHVQSAFSSSSPSAQGEAVIGKNGKGGDGKGVLGIVSGLFGFNSGPAGSEAAASSQPPREYAQASGVIGSTAAAAENEAASIQDKAKNTWHKEIENQQRGGSLDQLGFNASGSEPKKGWGFWSK